MILTFLKKTEFTKSEVSRLPKEPGIYIYWTEKGIPLYVGKSVSLRSRVSSYLNFPLEPKTKKMISLAKYFSTIRVASELEALLLEAKLVRTLDPQYNIQLKDDKHPLYIRITKSAFPMVLTARKIDAEKNNNLAVYGPFPSSKNVAGVLKMIRRTIPFAQHEPSSRTCIYKQIGLCDPCPSEIVSEKDEVQRTVLERKYKKNIKDIKNILDGNISKLVKQLETKMIALSKDQLFEEALKVRTKIERLSYITQPITNPYEFIQNPNLITDLHDKEMSDLRDILKAVYPKIKRLKRIECFDIAHLAGTSPTASMVTFINAEANKNLYRRFKIYQKKGNDDYASLSEVARRRLKHLGDWGRPDLIIVDGGKGQVLRFFELFEPLGVPVMGIAKRLETIVIPTPGLGSGFWQKRPGEGPALHLIQRLRDESHRFARVYHHKLVENELISKD